MSEDALSSLLRSVHLRGALYFHVRGSRDWVAEAPPAREIAAAVLPGAEHVMEYHVVIAGSCWGGVVGASPIRLEPGDIILFPHGDPHVVSSAPGMRAPPDVPGYFARRGRRLPFTVRFDAAEVPVDAPGEADGDTTLVCGFLGCDLHPFNPLIEALPRIVHRRDDAGRSWTALCMRRAVAESASQDPGSGAVLDRLSEMMFIDAVRGHLAGLPADSRGWLAGLRDRFVGHALALLHDDPGRTWSVEELGNRVGLSRSALHDRFAATVGDTPMRYLARWRIQVAAARLRDTGATVASIALEVGYESEAAFARAFKRTVGEPPATWRRRAKS
jgi:AraC-like DNA-binding protein